MENNELLEKYKGIIKKIKPISQQLEQLEQEKERLESENEKRRNEFNYAINPFFEPNKAYIDTDFEIAIVESKIVLAIKEVKEIIEGVK